VCSEEASFVSREQKDEEIERVLEGGSLPDSQDTSSGYCECSHLQTSALRKSLSGNTVCIYLHAERLYSIQPVLHAPILFLTLQVISQGKLA
jgi:hypothetical protein